MSNPQNRAGCFRLFFILILCLSLFFNFLLLLGSLFASTSSQGKFRETVLVQPKAGVKSKVAVISLRGVISGYSRGNVGDSMVEDIQLQLDQALEDKKVSAIVLAVDSPGGEVTASDILYEAICEADKIKPVIVSMGALATSGGYYVSMGARHVFAHETTITGSIGVIMQAINYSDLLGKVGVQMLTLKSGKFKDILNGSRAITDEERELMQNNIMQSYARFLGIVAKERNLSEESLRNGMADGRPLSGRDAFNAKLVDDIGGFDAAIKKAMELANTPGSQVVRYESPVNLGSVLRLLGQYEQKQHIELNLTHHSDWDIRPGYQYLLPAHFAP